MKTKYTVTLHDFHGGAVVYEGISEAQAIRAARKHDCTRSGKCVAGPTLSRQLADGTRETACFWQAGQPAEIEWLDI